MVSTEINYCSDFSISLGEPVFATAPRIEAWVLLEYPYAHPAKALKESTLQENIKAHLSAALDSIPHSRLLMIKRSNRKPQSGVNLILALSGTNNPRMTRFQLKDYPDIPSIDLEAAFTELANNPEKGEVSPLILICTNGKRDVCCARYGLPLFNEMRKYDRADVWQSSHMGGHRFAANVISLPYGIYYARIPVSGAGLFVEHCSNGEINLPYYRGRTCYTAEQQAAEYLLRQHNGNLAVHDLLLQRTSQTDEDRWQVEFRSQASENFIVSVRKGVSSYTIIESCGSPQKAEPQPIYHLDEIIVGG